MGPTVDLPQLNLGGAVETLGVRLGAPTMRGCPRSSRMGSTSTTFRIEGTLENHRTEQRQAAMSTSRQLLAVVPDTVLVVAGLHRHTSARLGGRRPVAEILRSELA